MTAIHWTDWITLDAKPEPTRKKVRGGEMLVMPSPYDIPDAVRAGYDFTSNELIIQFRYIESDASMARDIGQVAKMYVGRHSGRLMGITVSVDGFPKDSDVGRAAESLKRAVKKAPPTRPEREENFRLVQRGFERTRARVAEALAAPLER